MYSLPSYNYHQLQDRMKTDIVLINTLPNTRQESLIKGTIRVASPGLSINGFKP